MYVAVVKPKTEINAERWSVFTVPTYVTRFSPDLNFVAILASPSWIFFSFPLELELLNSESHKLAVSEQAVLAHQQCYSQLFL